MLIQLKELTKVLLNKSTDLNIPWNFKQVIKIESVSESYNIAAMESSNHTAWGNEITVWDSTA